MVSGVFSTNFQQNIFLPFSVMGESPKTFGIFFRWISVMKNTPPPTFLKIFQKFQKEVLDEYHGHLTTFCDFPISAVFGSKIFEKWKHAAWFHFSKIFDPKTAEIAKSQKEVICPRVSSNTSFWNILRNVGGVVFCMTESQRKNFRTFSGIPP